MRQDLIVDLRAATGAGTLTRVFVTVVPQHITRNQEY